VLEVKPEEKLWQVVKETWQTKLELFCFRLRKRDLIKVGRVRFKIREVMSPIYQEFNRKDDLNLSKHRKIYPTQDVSVVSESDGASILV